MSEYVCRVERLANGYEVELTDPKIVEQNNSASKLGSGSKPWRDPKVCYAFKTVKEVLDFLSKHLETALPMNEYENSFAEAAKEMETENDD